tara:strand:+ start:197147 stop:197542 length:396 start_codon:yes stop_codon:yes gene_type:complete
MHKIKYKKGALPYVLTPLCLMFTSLILSYISFNSLAPLALAATAVSTMLTSSSYLAISRLINKLDENETPKSIQNIYFTTFALWVFGACIVLALLFKQSNITQLCIVAVMSFAAAFQFYKAFSHGICTKFH